MRNDAYPSPADFAILPRSPKNCSPVPELTSLYHNPRRGDYGDSRYPGNCSGNLIRDLLRYFQPTLVFDPMTGSGTCGDVCVELGIACVSDDLRNGFDACDPESMPDGMQFDFVWIHPPYWRQKVYSDDPRDLSSCATWDSFLDRYHALIENCASVLAPGGKLAVLMGDYCDHEAGFVPLTYQTKQLAFITGLRQCCTDIIRFSHGATSSKKEYRSSFIPGLHDVCMVFEKPADATSAEFASESQSLTNAETRLRRLAETFRATCEERLSTLQDEMISSRENADESELDDLQGQIDHWYALLGECERVISCTSTQSEPNSSEACAATVAASEGGVSEGSE